MKSKSHPDDSIVVYGLEMKDWVKLWDVYTNFVIFSICQKYLIDIKYQTNQVQPGETSQIAVVVDEPILQVPNNNQPEASEHETSSQLEQIKHVQSDDTVVNMTQHDPSSQMMQNNQSEMDMQEPLFLQGK